MDSRQSLATSQGAAVRAATGKVALATAHLRSAVRDNRMRTGHGPLAESLAYRAQELYCTREAERDGDPQSQDLYPDSDAVPTPAVPAHLLDR
jgi:hypothetical protein